MLPSPFRHLHSRVFCLAIEIFGFLRAILVMAIEIVDHYFYAEDCCDGEVILAYVFPSCYTPPLLSMTACYLPYSIHSALLCAYVLLDLLDLVEVQIDTLELLPALLREFLV
jgi:hypothetical protein